MKCRYTFAVVSDAALDPSLRFRHKSFDFTLVSEKGRLSAIIVEVSGIHFPKPPNITHPVGGLTRVNLPSDPMLDIVQTEMRTIRGALCLWQVHDIDVDSPKIDWIPETDEEKKSTDVFGFSQKTTPRGQGKPLIVAQDLLVRSIIAREKLLPLQIPLEFLRRGWDDIFHGRYIEAIYDFYFIFEYLYADGGFKQKATKEALLAEKEVTDAVAEAQRDPHPLIRERPALMQIFVEKYQSKSIEDVVETIIGVRGFLHHQSMKRRDNWNPAVQSEFKVDALFMLCASHNAVIKRSNEILFLPDEVSTFQLTGVFTPDGRKINWVPLPNDATSVAEFMAALTEKKKRSANSPPP